jgi:hypothetical protein
MVATWDLTTSRRDLHVQMEFAREKTHDIIKRTWNYKRRYLKGLSEDLEHDVFEVHSIRPVRRVGPEGQILTDLLVEITQKRPGRLDKDFGDITDRNNLSDFWFRGGCTILIDMKTTQLRYCIFKDINDKNRYQKQQEYYKKRWRYNSLRELYIGDLDKTEDDTFYKNLHQYYLKGEE